MKRNVFVLGLLAAALAFGFVLAGCGGDDDDGVGGGLPPISEPTTGQPSVTGSNIAVLDLATTLSHTQGETNGVAFSVANGKLSFELTTPNNAAVWDNSEGNDLAETLFGKTTGEYAATATPNEAKFAMVNWFSFSDITGSAIRRWTGDGDGVTYANTSRIVYVYADRDVILSRIAKNWTESSGSLTITFKCDAVSLALKTGWNLVQSDGRATMNGNTMTATVTAKIATNNVPWALTPIG
jgi:hypothetical protein